MEHLIQNSIQTLIYRTNIRNARDVVKVQKLFEGYDEITRWTIDLDDWEKVLKVESKSLGLFEVAGLLHQIGFECSELDH